MHFSLTSRHPYRLTRLSIRLEIIRVPSIEQFRSILISPLRTSIYTLSPPVKLGPPSILGMSSPTSPMSPNGLCSSPWQDKLQGGPPKLPFHVPHISFHIPRVDPTSIIPLALAACRLSRENANNHISDHCRRSQLHPPVFNIVSDRRGGRTAWSSTVTIRGNQTIHARFWYDGQYVNNAKEDAAEVALQTLTGAPGSPPQSQQQQQWAGRQGIRAMGM